MHLLAERDAEAVCSRFARERSAVLRGVLAEPDVLAAVLEAGPGEDA